MTRLRLKIAVLFWLPLLLACKCMAAETYWVMRVDGAIGPGVADYLQRNLAEAPQQAEPPQFLLITLDTPGGLDASLRAINQAVLASTIPVVLYVSPSGARAASAGTFMLYAAHIAAMAPATSLGAATPVQLAGPGGTPQQPQDETDDKQQPTDNTTALRNKQINDAVAYMRSLAKLRNRNLEFAEKAVLEAATLTSDEALKQGVIDILAKDQKDLLQQLNGLQVEIKDTTHTFKTENLVASQRLPDWRNQLLTIITDPNVAYIMMLIGIYGLILEFYSPGFGVAGTIGAISLLLALLAFQMLPINYAGLALILLGIALLLGEALAPSFGALGFGGVVAFVLGSIILMDNGDEAFQIAWPVIAAFAVTSILFLVILVRMLVKVRSSRTVSGSEAILDAYGVVKTATAGHGEVWLQGEVWEAVSSSPLHQGQKVRVLSRRGLILTVEPQDSPRSDGKTQHIASEEG